MVQDFASIGHAHGLDAAQPLEEADDPLSDSGQTREHAPSSDSDQAREHAPCSDSGQAREHAPSPGSDRAREHAPSSDSGQTREHAPSPGSDRAREHAPAAAGASLITVRALSGLSGDMMLAGLAGLIGVNQEELDALVEELRLPALTGTLKLAERQVHGITGLGCRITLPHEHAHRNLADVLDIIAASAMPPAARERAATAFTLLAEAEAAVHGKSVDQVHFHEVGALDSILDTCLVCRLYTLAAPVRFVCSPLPLADGMVRCAHGVLPAPAPAVLRLLEDVPVCGFAGEGETVTPTALSLLKALRAEFGPWPAMTVRRTTISYGTKEFRNAPNGAVWALGSA